MEKARVTIIFCTRCKWMLRATWMAQELLSTFEQELEAITIKPDDTGGVFEIHVDDHLLFSRAAYGRFPEIKELKQLMRDVVAPGRNLGHIDSSN
jgi:selenoprotein W-related protein